MSMMDKLKFWKHEPHLDLDSGVDLGTESFSQPNLGLQDPMQQSAQPMQQNPMQQNPMGMPDPMTHGLGQPGLGSPSASFEQPRIIEQPRPLEQQQNIRQDSYDKNLEIVSMKLDNLKVALENMNQRIINIERIATESQKQEPKRPRW